MGTKKDIGNIFKERFKDFEQAPDSNTWDAIASELDRKGNRKITPLWLIMGGLLVVGTVVSIWLYTTPQNEESQVEIQTVENVRATTRTDAQTISNSENSKINNSIEEVIPSATNTNQPAIGLEKENKKIKERTDKTNSYLETITSSQNDDSNYTKVNIKTSYNTTNTTQEETKEKQNTTQYPYRNQEEVTVEKVKTLLEKKHNDRLAQKKVATLSEKLESKEPAGSIDKVTEDQLKKRALGLEEYEKGLKENQEDGKSETKKINQDSQAPEERKIDREKSSKYIIAVSPYSSVLSYGSITKGSSLDDRLVDNPREAISTFGYGVRVEYTLSESTRLRLGVGYAPLKYRTDNFQVSITNGSINIYELAALSGQALNQNSGTTENSPEALAFFNDNNVVSIQQNLSYLEVPLDFQYMIINERMGLSVSPGLSLFILNDNSIIATADNGQSIFLGKETNLTKTSLGFNLGLGGHYNLNRNWRFNVEPVFRYQLNPYSNNTNNFRPYYFGGQFGLSYKF